MNVEGGLGMELADVVIVAVGTALGLPLQLVVLQLRVFWGLCFHFHMAHKPFLLICLSSFCSFCCFFSCFFWVPNVSKL